MILLFFYAAVGRKWGGRSGSGEDTEDFLRDEVGGIFQRKVASVEQVQFGFGDVAQIRLSTLDGEEGIVLTPHDQSPGLLPAEEGLPGFVVRKVCLVIVKQIELDGVVAGTIEEVLIEGIRVRADAALVLDAMRVLEFGGLQCEST